jgi:hypothetical protein
MGLLAVWSHLSSLSFPSPLLIVKGSRGRNHLLFTDAAQDAVLNCSLWLPKTNIRIVCTKGGTEALQL